MGKLVGQMTEAELEDLIGRVVSERLNVLFVQLMDALADDWDEECKELKPEFEEGLRRAMEQARRGEGVDLETFRAQLGR